MQDRDKEDPVVGTLVDLLSQMAAPAEKNNRFQSEKRRDIMGSLDSSSCSRGYTYPYMIEIDMIPQGRQQRRAQRLKTR